MSDRLLVWNYKDLGEYPRCVTGVRPFAPPRGPAPTRTELFYLAAASRPSFYRERCEASAEDHARYELGECWWMDGSRRFVGDIDGNLQSTFMFEALTGFPFFWFDKDKTGASTVRAMEAHELRLRTILPGVTVKRYCGDFDASHARQGDPGRVQTAELRAYLATRPGLTIVPMPPHSPNANFAENNMGLVNALAFACALGGNLNMATASTDMLRGAEYLYAMRLCPPDKNKPDEPRVTRYTALTGRKWDVSRFPGPPGQLCWVYDENSGAVGRRRVLSGYLVCPDAVVSGIWVRLLGSLRLRLVRSAAVLDDAASRAVLLSGSALATFRGSMVDPSAAALHERLSSLLADYGTIPPADLDMVVYKADPRTGVPTAVTRYVPAIDDLGELVMQPAPAPAPALQGGAPLTGPGPLVFTAVPVGPKHVLSPAVKSWFLALPADTPIELRYDVNRQSFRRDGQPNASYFRRLEYAAATTVRGLGALQGVRREDVFFDLARGDILVAANFPAEALCSSAGQPAGAPATPEAATLRAIMRLAALEDSSGRPDDKDTVMASDGLRFDGLAPVRAMAASLLRDALADSATAATTEGFQPDDMLAYEPPLAAAAFALLNSGRPAGSPTAPPPPSVRTAYLHPDYHGPGGWHDAIQEETRRVCDVFKAVKLISAADYRAALAQYGPDRVSIVHMVVALRDKYRPDGTFDKRKARFTVADKAESKSQQDFYAGCASSFGDRLATQLAVQYGWEQTVVDVTAAYYQGDAKPVDQDGRFLASFIPTWLQRYTSRFPEFDASGRRNMILFVGNVPGRRDAGKLWAVRYHAFLRGYGLSPCVYDALCFVMFTDEEVLIILVHVDDTKITASTAAARIRFVTAWKREFSEPVDVEVIDDNFVGLRHRRVDDRTCEITCQGTIDNLLKLLEPYPLPRGVSAEYPMGADALAIFREGPSEANPLVPELVPAARQIVGTLVWVTATRHDALFATRQHSHNASEQRLTRFAWNEILRTGHYVTGTRDLPLVIRRVPEGTQFEVHVDSSSGNAFAGRSWGGSCGGYPGSGMLTARCTAPPAAAESSGVVELHQAVLAVKSTLGVRILMRELGVPPAGPTLLHTDAQVVVDAVKNTRVSQEAKWVAPRYAMVRKAVEDGAIEIRKVATRLNCADIFTKPLTGQAFFDHRAIVLGLNAPPVDIALAASTFDVSGAYYGTRVAAAACGDPQLIDVSGTYSGGPSAF